MRRLTDFSMNNFDIAVRYRYEPRDVSSIATALILRSEGTDRMTENHPTTTCARCGSPFVVSLHNKKFCSFECFREPITAGTVFGFLRVIAEAESARTPLGIAKRAFEVECVCGKRKTTRLSNFRNLKHASCGCKTKEFRKPALKPKPLHGMSVRSGRFQLYIAWSGMKRRCYNQNIPEYKHYGGRGIRVFEGWVRSAPAFADWIESNIGTRPTPQHSLDRIDTNGDYAPGNLRWATPTQQSRNRRNTIRFTHLGITKTVNEWVEETGLHRSTIMQRIVAGVSSDKVLFKGSLRCGA